MLPILGEKTGDDLEGHGAKAVYVPFHQQYSLYLQTTGMDLSTGILSFKMPLRTEPAGKSQYIRKSAKHMSMELKREAGP